jgi:hypothetical protein
MRLLKLSLKLGIFSAIFLTNPHKKAGGEGRNRTHTAYTSHSQLTVFIITDALKIKGSIHYVKVNWNWLFVTLFYSLPLWPAGISAGTFSTKIHFNPA